jgi:4-amino-4-deoxy-L-arabinose transferase-like glycosyltransferase
MRLNHWEESPPYLAAAGVTLVVLLLGISTSRLIYPYDVGYYDACVWEPARLAVEGRNPYEYSTTAPFVMAPYGYVYYLVIGMGLKLFGMQLWFGRLLSIVAAGVCIVCVWRISFSLTGMRRAAWFAVVVALSSAVLQSWVAVQRPDLIALSLAFAGLALVFESGREGDRIGSRALLRAILFVLAFFTKQTLILPAFVASARYLQSGRKRNAWFVLLATVALATFAIVILNWEDQKGHWGQHYILAADIPHSYRAAMRMSAHWLIGSPLRIYGGWYSS